MRCTALHAKLGTQEKTHTTSASLSLGATLFDLRSHEKQVLRTEMGSKKHTISKVPRLPFREMPEVLSGMIQNEWLNQRNLVKNQLPRLTHSRGGDFKVNNKSLENQGIFLERISCFNPCFVLWIGGLDLVMNAWFFWRVHGKPPLTSNY